MTAAPSTPTPSTSTSSTPTPSTDEPATADTRATRQRTRLSRRAAVGLTLFGVWSWIIWLTFAKNIWADPRSFDHGPTAFLLVHVVLIVVSLVFGTAIGWLGVRGLRRGGPAT